MKQLIVKVLSISWWFLLVIPVAASVALLGSGVDGPSTAVVVVMATVLGIGLLSFLANLAGLDPQSAQIAGDLSSSELERSLLERWLRRSRHYRYIGGVVGFILGVGFDDNGGLEEGLAGLFVGIAVGGALAELHIVGSRPTQSRSADLTNRRLGDYVSPSDSIAMAAIAIAGCATAVAAVISGPPAGSRSLTYALVSVAIVALTLGLQYMVVSRPRPAVSQELRNADNLLRHLAASQGFARPAIAVALLSLAGGVANLGSSENLGLTAIAIAIVGIIWYVRSRQTAVVRIARRSQAAVA